MLTDYDKDMIRLLQRSTDRGDGWRTVSPTLWKLFDTVDKDLFELDEENRKVRLTETGLTLAMYI
jgi:preprotein translocase subunit SecA